MTRLRLALLVALAIAVLAGFSASQATAGSPTPSIPAPVERVEEFYATGPSADYAVDTGSIGTVPPVTWDVPGEGAVSAVVEVSFQYRTIGSGPFVVTLRVRSAEGTAATTLPEQLTVAPAPEGAAATVRFLAPELPAGHAYKAFVGVNSHLDRGHNRIGTRKMLVTVELSPTG